jgi:uncharacterized protein YneR
MKKNCLVVATYFGPRRTYPKAEEQTIEYLNKYLKFLIKLDSGTDSDIIITNHQHSEDSNILKKSLDYLSKWDNTKTKNGFLKVVSRPWENGIGASHKSFDYAFNLFKDDYEYWYFQEDDLPIVCSNYFSNCINQLDSDPELAFICTNANYFGGLTLTGSKHFLTKEQYKISKPFIEDKNRNLAKIIHPYNIHCHGGNGVTHKKYLKEIIDHHGSLPYHNNKSQESVELSDSEYKSFEADGEIMFTNILCQLGYRLEMCDTETPQPNKDGEGDLKIINNHNETN